MIKKLQNAIMLGRKIRDDSHLSVKTPLSRAVIVEGDKEAAQDFLELQNYIKEELNVLEFSIEPNEEEFVVYSSVPENLMCGQNLKKQYNKDFKQRLSSLTRAECITYLKEKRVVIDGVEIKEGWLTITKDFNEKQKSLVEQGVDSNLDASVLLVKTLDDNLFKMRVAREIVNSVQRLRK